jgi:outer membrane protein
MHRKLGIPLFIIIFAINSSTAQSDLNSLLGIAEKNYPLIAAKQAEAEAAYLDISLQKNSLIPSLDISYQANYATYNNITGMSYPGLIPISGPPSTDNFYNAVPGSAAAVLLKWNPLTFGQRSASLDNAKSLYEKHLAEIDNEILRVKFRVALIYLDIASTKELIKTYQKNIERNEFNLKHSQALVSAGIRPSADSLRFRGELSKARTALYKLNNLLETQKEGLREFLLTEQIADIEMNEFFFNTLPSLSLPSENIENPALRIARYTYEANQASLSELSRSWVPKLEFWGTSYARGSGIKFDGTIDRADGLTFSRYNYGVGFQLEFPILEMIDIRFRTNRQRAITRSSEQYLNHTETIISSQEKIARNELATSLLVAREIPIEYEAVESALNALQTRYNSGLIDYTELIQAQYDLLNAEAGLKNAYISAWKSLLTLAVIRGDVNIFLNQIQN